MTKYKEYLRAHGVELECDFEFLPCNGIESVETRVVGAWIVVIAHFNSITPQYIAYNRYGECVWGDTNGDMSCIERFNCDPEYVDWLEERCDALPNPMYNSVITTMERVYTSDAKVRIAFKHLMADIMNQRVYDTFITKRYQKVSASELIVKERY